MLCRARKLYGECVIRRCAKGREGERKIVYIPLLDEEENPLSGVCAGKGNQMANIYSTFKLAKLNVWHRHDEPGHHSQTNFHTNGGSSPIKTHCCSSTGSKKRGREHWTIGDIKKKKNCVIQSCFLS
jgi:hypothetical protein